MFVIPLNFPAILFLSGALFASFIAATPYLAWLQWVLGVFLAIIRFRSIRQAILTLWRVYYGRIDLFSLSDLNLMRLVSFQRNYWNIVGTWRVTEHMPITATIETAAQEELLQIAMDGQVTVRSRVLIRGGGCAQEGLFLHRKFGCFVACLDTDFEKVQIGNDCVSAELLWKNIHVNVIESNGDFGELGGAETFDVVCGLSPSFWIYKEQFHEDLVELVGVGKPGGLILTDGMIFRRPKSSWLSTLLVHLIPNRIKNKFIFEDDLRVCAITKKTFSTIDRSADFIGFASTYIETSRNVQEVLSYWAYLHWVGKLVLLKFLIQGSHLKYVRVILTDRHDLDLEGLESTKC